MQLNYLCRNSEYQVIWFHDSFDVFPSLIKELDHRTYVIYSFSWYAQPQRLGRIFERIMAAIAQAPTPHIGPDRIMFLMNSSAEFNTALQLVRLLSVSFRISFVNNACFVDSGIYNINPEVEKNFSAVCNSKPLFFKRHWLSEKVENKIFITYDFVEPHYGLRKAADLAQFKPIEIFGGVSANQVVTLLNRSKVGLILSEEEGACYASIEYLLCGLPVVSTESRGGRNEYYTNENSIIVAADASEVCIAVGQLLGKIETGAIDADAIRRGAIERMQKFRNTLLTDLSALLAGEKDHDVAVERVRGLLPKHSKMQNYRNFHMKLDKPSP